MANLSDGKSFWLRKKIKQQEKKTKKKKRADLAKLVNNFNPTTWIPLYARKNAATTIIEC